MQCNTVKERPFNFFESLFFPNGRYDRLGHFWRDVLTFHALCPSKTILKVSLGDLLLNRNDIPVQ